MAIRATTVIFTGPTWHGRYTPQVMTYRKSRSRTKFFAVAISRKGFASASVRLRGADREEGIALST
jgi:hypothetical protein